jgi:hypothetical protein
MMLLLVPLLLVLAFFMDEMPTVQEPRTMNHEPMLSHGRDAFT